MGITLKVNPKVHQCKKKSFPGLEKDGTKIDRQTDSKCLQN